MRSARKLAVMLTLALSGCGPPPASPRGSAPNVLVVLLDDVGLDGIASYGLAPTPPSTPTIDGLAARGVRFTHAFASPVCAPSRAALLTGRHGRRTGFGGNIPFNRFDTELSLDEVTLAELVGASTRGRYRSGVFGKWHLSTASTPGVATFPHQQGFDHAVVTFANISTFVLPDETRHDYFHWEEVRDGAILHRDGYNTSATIDDAIAGIETLGEPWLVYLPLHAAHEPLHVPPASLQGTGATPDSPAPQKARAMIEAADTELARLLEALGEEVLARTTVFVMGDNGAETWASELPLRGGKGTFFDAGIRVPLVVAGPQVVRPGVSDALVHLVDVFPTVAEISGSPLPQRRTIDGRSLLPYLADPARRGARTTVFTEMFSPHGRGPYAFDRQAISDGRYKLVRGAHDGVEWLTEVGPSPADEGADLLPGGLSAEQARAHEALGEALSAFVEQLRR